MAMPHTLTVLRYRKMVTTNYDTPYFGQVQLGPALLTRYQ
jgi:hypothetical protein